MDEAAVWQSFGLLQNIHKDLDYLAELLSFLSGPVCKDNCGVCCNQSIYIPEVSVQYMAFSMKTNLPEKRQNEITGRLRKWLLYTVPGVRSKFAVDSDAERVLRKTEVNNLARLRCPLLSEANKCLIYPWRDVSCRAWGVTRPMSDICRRPLHEGETEYGRHHITRENALLGEVLHLVDDLEALLMERLPDGLNKVWLPTELYRLLCPQDYALIKPQVQEAKNVILKAPGMWLITKEDLQYVNKEVTLKDSIVVC